MIRVAVVGMGIIGKRAVHAVERQPDMTLAAVVIRSPGTSVLARRTLPYYAFHPGSVGPLRNAGVEPRGTLPNALICADVVVDCGPSRSGIERYPLYRDAGVHSIFCGGERTPELGPLVHPDLNYADALRAPSCRLTSCNTTALARLVAALGPARIHRLHAVVLRCSTDSDKAAKGITNGAALATAASHHADDLRTVVPALAAQSVAATLPMTCGHVIHTRVRLHKPIPGDRLQGILASARRIVVRSSSHPLDTATVKDTMSQTGRRWNDRYEVLVQCVENGSAHDHELWLSLDNEAVTIPEMIDVIRAVGGKDDPLAARQATDVALGVGQGIHALIG
jgi:glyceraldehyde-3-phosphate dehydrogenase (NAD(P))